LLVPHQTPTWRSTPCRRSLLHFLLRKINGLNH